ncbi:hypothetical protein RchiOBHm_Chr4g0440491 [Rosa chinensis]|uniref:Uncharacterized protein n=1 Tax=Rosa chinensis TaxID=74649 RepID=A0A2P6R354_ROSCH|nr:hypothetical protein RchiOBHm_Chr4g0440491 [Rosa chinensis]
MLSQVLVGLAIWAKATEPTNIRAGPNRFGPKIRLTDFSTLLSRTESQLRVGYGMQILIPSVYRTDRIYVYNRIAYKMCKTSQDIGVEPLTSCTKSTPLSHSSTRCSYYNMHKLYIYSLIHHIIKTKQLQLDLPSFIVFFFLSLYFLIFFPPPLLISSSITVFFFISSIIIFFFLFDCHTTRNLQSSTSPIIFFFLVYKSQPQALNSIQPQNPQFHDSISSTNRSITLIFNPTPKTQLDSLLTGFAISLLIRPRTMTMEIEDGANESNAEVSKREKARLVYYWEPVHYCGSIHY